MNLSSGSLVSITSAFICFLHYAGVESPAIAHGELGEQITEVSRQIALDSTNAELFLKRGELHRYHRDWKLALVDFDRANLLDSTLYAVDLGRGKTLFEGGWFMRAKVYLDRFLLRMPDNTEALLTRARVLRELGEYLAAAVDFSQALNSTAEPRPEYYLERARVLQSAGPEYLAAAISGIDDGIARLGQIVTLQLAAVDFELQAGKHDSALQRIAAIASQSPRQEKWLFRRGEILIGAGRLPEAREAFQKALIQIEKLPPRTRALRATIALESQVRSALVELEAELHKEDRNGSS